MKSKIMTMAVLTLLLISMTAVTVVSAFNGSEITEVMPTSQDAYIEADRSTSNFGGYHTIKVRASTTYPYRTLVQFDLSSLPSSANISSAVLRLYYYQYLGNDPVNGTLWAYRITQGWIEGDEPSDPYTHEGVWWSSYDGNPTPHSWTTAGGDYNTTNGAAAIVPGSYGWMNWTVTDIVKAWVEDGQENNGFLIKDATEITETGYQIMFRSREYNGQDPILEITYIAPVGGEILSVNTLQVLTPYVVALMVLVGAVGFLSKKRLL
jgi:hypothetical protein